MPSASTGQVAWAVLIFGAVCGLAGGPYAPAAEPSVDLGLAPRGNHLPVQFVERPLSPDLPLPENEADVTPQNDVLPSLSGTPIDSETVPQGQPWLFAPPSLGDDEVGQLISEIIASEGTTDVDLPAPVYNTGTWFRNGNWYTQQDFLMMQQRRLSRGTVPHAQSLFLRKGLLAFDTFAGITISRVSRNFNIDSLFQRFEPGTRLTLGRYAGRDAANRDHAIELTYLGLIDWSSRASFAGQPTTFDQPPNSIRTTLGGIVLDAGGSPTAIFVPGFSDADIQQFQYASDFNSVEVNLRLQGRPDRDIMALQPNGNWIRHSSSARLYSFLVGLRYMTINDSFVLFSEGAEILDGGGAVIIPETRGLYEVRTHNDMVGVQAGVEITEKYSSWNWGFRGKAGGFTNFVDRESNIETLNGIDSRSEKVDDKNFAFLVEAGVFVAYHIRPNVALRSAADVIYIPSGTADVQRNLSLQPTFSPLNVTGRRLYQSLSMGFEAVW